MDVDSKWQLQFGEEAMCDRNSIQGATEYIGIRLELGEVPTELDGWML